MWGADWKFSHQGNCSAWQGLLRDAEQLHRWLNFQFAPKNHYGFFFLHSPPLTIAFRLEYVLFYHIYAKIYLTTFFDQEKFSTAPLLYNDAETFGENWRENEIKTSKMTPKSRPAWESSYTPNIRRHFLAPVRFTGKSQLGRQENVFMPCANNKGANPEDRFSRDVAHIYYRENIRKVNSSSVKVADSSSNHRPPQSHKEPHCLILRAI